MDIPKQVEKLWHSNETYLETTVSGWLLDLERNQQRLLEARKKFHEWHPLRIYTSVSNAKSGTLEFSVRFHGQEVAKLRVNEESYLCIDEKKVQTLRKYFPNLSIPKGDVEWRSPEATNFRKFFIEAEKVDEGFTLRSEEHRIESHIIKEMEGDSTKKFSGKFRDIQPVKLYKKFPFQMPVPISGFTGEPYIGDGNIDILARHGIGRGTRLSVWELKKPGLNAKKLTMAINQSLIYASTMIMMLGSKCGEGWFKAFGFKKLPASLEVEAVVVIHLNQKALLGDVVNKCGGFGPLQVGNHKILPCVAFYDKHYDVVEFIPNYL